MILHYLVGLITFLIVDVPDDILYVYVWQRYLFMRGFCYYHVTKGNFVTHCLALRANDFTSISRKVIVVASVVLLCLLKLNTDVKCNLKRGETLDKISICIHACAFHYSGLYSHFNSVYS